MSGPDVWGPHGWKFIHYITMGYPNVPTEEDKLKYYNFFHSLKHVIPCSICGAHFKENLEKTPLDINALSSKLKLMEWGIKMHNHVNKKNKKKEYTTEEGIDLLINSKETCEIPINKTINNNYNTCIISISILLNIMLILFIIIKYNQNKG
jgi:hypothetical protein